MVEPSILIGLTTSCARPEYVQTPIHADLQGEGHSKVLKVFKFCLLSQAAATNCRMI
jgi:hypothetical protein